MGGATAADVAVTQPLTDRDSNGVRDHVSVATRLINTGTAARPISATLSVGGRTVQTQHVNVPASGALQVAFTSIPVPNAPTKASISITPDSLTLDDVSNFTIAPDASVPVLIVEPNSPRTNQSLYMSRALSIGDRPSFRVDVKSIGALTPRDVDGRSLVVLDEVAPPSPTGAVGQQLKAVLDEGGGIVFVPGAERTETWAQAWRAMLPATIGPVVDRARDAGGSLSSIDYASPVFELFNAPRSGDFTTARFYRYRALTASPGALISARFDDGSPALVERAVGSGRVVVWASTIDSYWTNLPLQPVFLPFVHQFGKHVGRYIDPRPSFMTGEVLDLSRHGELTAPFLGGRTADSLTELTLESPSGVKQRVTATGRIISPRCTSEGSTSCAAVTRPSAADGRSR